MTQLSAMFAGGEIDQESKDAAMAALNAVYWKHKEENRERYTTKKKQRHPIRKVKSGIPDIRIQP